MILLLLAAQIGSAHSPLIHGEDTRLEPYQLEAGDLRRLVESRSVALIAPGPERTFATAAQLCEEEPFGEQPARAVCSGVLIDRDRVLTAGHCVEEQECGSLEVRIGWRESEDGSERETARRRCAAVVERRTDPVGVAPRLDFALLRLDEPVDVEPVPIAAEPSDRLLVAGHPGGIPLKVDTEATLVDRRDGTDWFSVAADTYTGSSGSAVYTEDRRLVGVVVRGGTDFAYQFDRNCFSSRRVDEGGEAVSYAGPALAGRGCGGGGLGACVVPLLFGLGRRRLCRRRVA